MATQSQMQQQQQSQNRMHTSTLPKLNRGERTMPKWVTETHDRVGPKPPPPPPSPGQSNGPAKPPALPPKTTNQPEPDYEVIEFSGQQYSNEPMVKHSSGMRPKSDDANLKCTLCGSNNPWVRCDECAQQIFCASCDDMFHKHPKRKTHMRKTIEQNLPPLPAKVVPGQPRTGPPVAPPRRGKRGFPTPLMQRKDQVTVNSTNLAIPPSPTLSVRNPSWHERVGSLKSGLNLSNRPLPDTPKTSTPSDDMSSRSTTPRSVFDAIQRPPSVTLEKIKSKASATLDRMALLQQRYRQQKEEKDGHRSGSVIDQRQIQQQRQIGVNRNAANMAGARNMSTSVFNLNQMNRIPTENGTNVWPNNQMQQAQSMAHLNCANCSTHNGNWNTTAQRPPRPMNNHPQDGWNQQLGANQQLNRSNLSLNMHAGYMMPSQHGGGMFPPPVFMNQRGMVSNMYPYPYPGMPVMNPGVMAMPPTARSRAASRVSSRQPSPSLSRKSISLRKKRSSFTETEPTDDEDSDQDDRRSLMSNRSGMSGTPRTRQRRLSSISQGFHDDDTETANQRHLRSKVRDQRRGSVTKSIQSEWLPDRHASTSNIRPNESNASSPLRASRIYSDLDSEGSGTKALVQAKIQQKLDEEPKRKPKAKEPQKTSEAPLKKSTEVQTGTLKSTKKTAETDPKSKPQPDENIYINDNDLLTTATQQEAPEETDCNRGEVTATESEDKDGSPPLGPPPSTPDHEWECEFCTFVNEPKVKICTICCKTPSKPPTKPVPKAPQETLTKTNTSTTTESSDTTTTASAKASSYTRPITNGVSKIKISHSQDDSETAISKMKDSEEDIWAVLDENIQAAAGEVIRNAESKKKQKESTSCGTSPIREIYVEAKEKESVFNGREATPPAHPQSISTQTYDTLPAHRTDTKECNTIESPSVLQASNTNRVDGHSSNMAQNQPFFHEPSLLQTERDRYRSSSDLRHGDILPIDYTPLPGLGRRQSSIAELLALQRAQLQSHSPLPGYTNDLPYYDLKPARDPETELYLLIKEAELYKFTSEELHIAMKHCSAEMHPVQWLRENWSKLIQTVQSLATKYGQERSENTIGTISQIEAREALRMHFGNIWQAVSECIEQRQRKYREISSKGNFSREDIVTALTSHNGNLETAFLDLSKTQLKPFLMRIWGSPGGVENESSMEPLQSSSLQSGFDTQSTKSEIHDFLNANASQSFEFPTIDGAFENSAFSSNDSHQYRMSDNISSYSQDSKENISNSFPLEDSPQNNKNMLKDLETLIGNMEQNQTKKNEEVLRSIETMISGLMVNNQLETEADLEATRILVKSPINSSRTRSTEKDDSGDNVKSFVWQHIQEIVPDLVQQVEKELMERDNDEQPMAKTSRSQPEPPPVNPEEFIMEEVIKPNLKEAFLREEVPAVYVYTAEIANFRMEFDRALDKVQENEFDFLTSGAAFRQLYKMFIAPKPVEQAPLNIAEDDVTSIQLKVHDKKSSTVKKISGNLISEFDRSNQSAKVAKENSVTSPNFPEEDPLQSQSTEISTINLKLENKPGAVESSVINSDISKATLANIDVNQIAGTSSTFLEDRITNDKKPRHEDEKDVRELSENNGDSRNHIKNENHATDENQATNTLRIGDNGITQRNEEDKRVEKAEQPTESFPLVEFDDFLPLPVFEEPPVQLNSYPSSCLSQKNSTTELKEEQKAHTSHKFETHSAQSNNSIKISSSRDVSVVNEHTVPSLVTEVSNPINDVNAETPLIDTRFPDEAQIAEKENTNQESFNPSNTSSDTLSNEAVGLASQIVESSKPIKKEGVVLEVNLAATEIVLKSDVRQATARNQARKSRIPVRRAASTSNISNEKFLKHPIVSLNAQTQENLSLRPGNATSSIKIEPKKAFSADNGQQINDNLEDNLKTQANPIHSSTEEIFQDVVELSSDEEKEDPKPNTSDTSNIEVNEANSDSYPHESISDGELFSVDSGDSIAEEQSSGRDNLKSPTSDSEMLLVFDDNPQTTFPDQDGVMPSGNAATINSTFNHSSIQAATTALKDFVPSSDPAKQNLTELVEDTQRLIKQMRDEINIVDLESSEEEYTDDYSDEYEDEEGEEEDDYDEEDGEEEEEEGETDFTEDLEENNNDSDGTQYEFENASIDNPKDTPAKGTNLSYEDITIEANSPLTEGFVASKVSISTAHDEKTDETQTHNQNLATDTSNFHINSTHSSTHEAMGTNTLNASIDTENKTLNNATQLITDLPTVASTNEANQNLANESNTPELTDKDIVVNETASATQNSLENQEDVIRTEVSLRQFSENNTPTVIYEASVVSYQSTSELPENSTSQDQPEENSSIIVAEKLTSDEYLDANSVETISTTELAESNVTHNLLVTKASPDKPALSVNSIEETLSFEHPENRTLSEVTDTDVVARAETSASQLDVIVQLTEKITELDGTPNSEASTTSMAQPKPTTKTTISKIPKPKGTSKASTKVKVPTRSKSFSGPPTPIGISSVKAIQLEFLNKQTQLKSTVTTLKNPPPAVKRKNSITEVITKLNLPSSSKPEGPSTSSGFRARTQPRIPKKKYHETCFSDDDYQTSTADEEPEETPDARERKHSVPVFRTYPSIQEPDVIHPEVLARKFVRDKLLDNLAEAQIAAMLVNMKFPQDVSLWAAKECSDLDQAIALLQQECELCMGTFALNQIVSMLKCTHKCCKQCAKAYFTVQITDRSINDCSCPFCKMPELHGQNQHEDENLEYFSNLDIFLKSILDTEVHELFQRKLRDRTLLQDPNFKWCIQCSSGFFARPKQKRLICPDCGSVTCSQCRKAWEKQHEGLSCEKFLEWKEANDPEIQAQGVQQHLAQHGIDCPKCKFRYSLARGGCMHFTCIQCKFEFCYGCAKPFRMGAKCNISPYCSKLGLHAHHPRNCLFYLRDKLPLQLQFLLKGNGVVFDVEPPSENEAGVASGRCPIQLQKETPKGMVDTVCNNDITDQHAGLCRTHYVEYLSAQVAKARIDPLPIFDLTDCVQELRRRGIALPERGPWDTDEIYKNMCSEIIKQKIPLESD